MFHKARIKLTVWYLLIIMAISIAFSAVIFLGLSREFDRLLRAQEYRLAHPEFHLRSVNGNIFQLQPDSPPPTPDPDVINEAKTRLLVGLIGVNTIILFLSAIAGYFLAGRTLRPIQKMVDEQNRFVTDASHELNTPLTSLRTTIEVNLREKQLTPKKIKEILQSNLEEVNNLQSLSSELIEMTRFEETAKRVMVVPIVLSDVLDSAIKAVMPLARKKRIELVSQSEKVLVKADAKSISELFTILLDNAIKYSPPGKKVTVVIALHDKQVRIRVMDEGIGIAKEDIPHIFDRFYRADKSRTKQHIKGYGLGLSIAKRIVTMYNGSIHVESTEGKGTTFIILFPKV